jgi:DNA-binding NtrC family response regulator
MDKVQTILIVDAETDFLEWAQEQLETPTTRVVTAVNSEQGYRMYATEMPDLLICDMHLQPFSGMELLVKVRQRDPNAMVVLTSSLATTQMMIEASKLGAFDFLQKQSLPFNFKPVVDAALKQQEDLRAATTFKPQLTVEQHQDSIVGQSQAMQHVFKMIGRVSHSEAPVMITGESGTGKELAASAIHRFSARAARNFVAINCAAIPEQLLESELFGHEKGAFTNAISQRVGRFEQSDGGTLFLDEIGDMPLPLQGKILRVLQNGEFSRVGSSATLKTDVRIVAATNKNLEQEVAARTFREDLFYRLNVVRIQIPPLRHRVEDVRLLAEYFLQKVAVRKHLPRLKLAEDAVRILESYPWPGNVRELENTIQRASVLATSDIILPKDLPLGAKDLQGDGAPMPVAPGGYAAPVELTTEAAIEVLLKAAQSKPGVELLPWLEREFTLHAMKATRGNQVRAAKLLGITRATLRKRIERFGITKELTIQ